MPMPMPKSGSISDSDMENNDSHHHQQTQSETEELDLSEEALIAASIAEYEASLSQASRNMASEGGFIREKDAKQDMALPSTSDPRKLMI